MGELSALTYIDDSGSVDAEIAIYGWIQVSPAAWRVVLRRWLDLRKELFLELGVHISTELHATKFINGREEISANAPGRLQDAATGEVLRKDLGREMGQRCLEMIRDDTEIRAGAVFRRTSAKGSAFNNERHDLYGKFVDWFDADLRSKDCYGLLTMDGQDQRYRDAHRALPIGTRHVIEDPALQDSRHSQWMQMADLVAYTAFMSLHRHAGNQFGWSWYNNYLGGANTLRSL